MHASLVFTMTTTVVDTRHCNVVYKNARTTTMTTTQEIKKLLLAPCNGNSGRRTAKTINNIVVVLTSNEILRKGLELVGFNWHHQQNVSRLTNLRRFKAHYRSDPLVYAQIWEDLQLMEIPEARIDTKKVDSGYADGKNYAINFPLNNSMDDKAYHSIFCPVIGKVMEISNWALSSCRAAQIPFRVIAGLLQSHIQGHAYCVEFV